MSTPRTREIIAAAAKLFKEKGYDATTIQDVADEVGMLKGSLYYHIKSKEELLYRVTKEPIRELIERQKKLMESDWSPQQKILSSSVCICRRSMRITRICSCFSRRRQVYPSRSKPKSQASIFAMKLCSRLSSTRGLRAGIFAVTST